MIEVSHLVKKYGSHYAVNDLSFRVEKGQIYGFLGPNGAGKSTTMNIITGYLAPTAGEVKINGHDMMKEPEEAKRCIGYLPEQPPLYMNETPMEYLRFVGEAKGLHGAELESQIEEVIRQTKIGDVKGRRISSLSKGYKQRVGIAQALLGNPRVIVLDEPTVGLDPMQIIEIRALIKELGQTHTVIFSSHILSEVQTICDRILIISKEGWSPLMNRRTWKKGCWRRTRSPSQPTRPNRRSGRSSPPSKTSRMCASRRGMKDLCRRISKPTVKTFLQYPAQCFLPFPQEKQLCLRCR